MENKELLLETSDGKPPKPCDSYDYESGNCKDNNKPCDMCYTSVMAEIHRERCLYMINWNNFIIGEAELECEDLEDAELLLQVCRENNIDCDYIRSEDFKDDPYWYVKNRSLEITRYYLDDENICSTWTVKHFIEEHIRYDNL